MKVEQQVNLFVFLSTCMVMHLVVGKNLTSISNAGMEQNSTYSTIQGHENMKFNTNGSTNNETILDFKKYPRNMKSSLMSALQGKFETINLSKLKSNAERNKTTMSSLGELDITNTNTRSKRNEECADSLRRRSVCPWEYEYSRNDTLLPELIKTISCQSDVTLMPHMTIQCHQLYSYKLFKKRSCNNEADHSCLIRKRVKSGCLAAFPCIVHTSG